MRNLSKRLSMIWLLLLCASPVGAETLSRAELPKYTQAIYRDLMDWALNRQMRETTATKTGTKVEYLRYGPDKALAICVDWAKSTPRAPVGIAQGVSYQQRSTARAREDAMFYCERFREGRACQCAIIDVNEKNVLELPAAFVARHFR